MIDRIEKIPSNIYFAKKQPKFAGPLDTATSAATTSPITNTRLGELPRDTYQRAVDNATQLGINTTADAVHRAQRGDQRAGQALNVVV